MLPPTTQGPLSVRRAAQLDLRTPWQLAATSPDLGGSSYVQSCWVRLSGARMAYDDGSHASAARRRTRTPYAPQEVCSTRRRSGHPPQTRGLLGRGSLLTSPGPCSEARRRVPLPSASLVRHRSGRQSTWGTSCQAGSRRSSATGRR
eukprot:scaffold378_cov419-Prasinococcus_capsulatus_cf.AAC.2